MTTARIAVPSAPGRAARTEEQRRSWDEQLKAREAEIRRQRELWSAISEFVSRHGGWLVSAPAERPLRLVVPVHSELPDKLFDLGYGLFPADGISGERIHGGRITPVVCYTFQIPMPR